MTLVRQIRLKAGPSDQHPFSLPVLTGLRELDLAAVTFFVGTNGAGKSTLLDGIARATRLPTLAGTRPATDDPAHALAARLTLVKERPVRHGYHFRAEDVRGFIDAVRREMREFAAMERQFESIEGDWGRAKAMGLARAQRDQLAATYGGDPLAKSHGELFLDVLIARITAPGLYLMDEPETPLAPDNQLALLTLINDAVAAGSQFVIATHSPILLALPGARILNFDQQPPVATAWNDLDHVNFTRAFLNHPERFLRHLGEPP
jgi:predicted ATPase